MAEPKQEENDKLEYGKREFRMIDTAAVNMEDFARDLYNGQDHYGDVREYNSANNSKHPENNLSLDWASRIGTEFTTEVTPGRWTVIDLPKVRAGRIYAQCKDETGQHQELDLMDLGVIQDETNNFKQVISKLLSHGTVDRKSRERLTKVQTSGE